MYEKNYAWLCCESQRSDVQAVFQFHRADPNGRWLHLPVYLERKGLDAYDVAELLQGWEDSWNDQEPQPEIMLTPKPSKREW